MFNRLTILLNGMITYILLPLYILIILHFIFVVIDNVLTEKNLFNGTKLDMIAVGTITIITVISNIIMMII